MLGAGSPMAIIWGSDYRLLYNDQYAEIIQDKHPSALGTPSSEVFRELWSSIAPLFDRVSTGEAVLNDDYQLVLTRGGITETAYFTFSYNPIFSDHGTVDGFLAVVIETTSRVVREKERAEVFETVLSSISDFAYTIDREGRFVYANKALLALWGLSLEETVGKNFHDLGYPADLAERLQMQIQQVIFEKKPVRDEARYVNHKGVEGYYEYILTPVFAADGSVLVVAGSTRDTTVRKKLELEALAASRAKDDFLARLSHELRTPLNPVLLLASASVEDSTLPAEVREDFRSIAENIKLEARLIDDLLDISRITHNKLPLNLLATDIHVILERVLENSAQDILQKRLVVSTRLDAQPCEVVGDEVRLHQVFSNLCRNAIKFTPEAGHILISTRLHLDKNDIVVVEISDTGIGLSEAELRNVFNPFAQGEHTEDGAEGFGGLGLGLAIASKLVELHSGTISATSLGRDRGATFTVELPLNVSTPAPGASAGSLSITHGPIPHRPCRVLLVEDHESSREALARLLTRHHFEVMEAVSAEEALELAKTKPFDLLISDLGLPDMDGYELMRTLKSLYGGYGIALSGYGTEQDIARSKEAGYMTHLIKPVESQALHYALNQFLAEAGTSFSNS